MVYDLDEAIDLAQQKTAHRAAESIGVHCNAVELLEEPSTGGSSPMC